MFRIRGFKLEVLTFVLGIALGIVAMHAYVKPQLRALESRAMAVEYLNRYRCYVVTCKTTQYTLDPKECSKEKSHKNFGVTRSGTKAIINWTVATDWDKIPMGSILLPVDNEKVKFRAEDTGNLVKGWHVDIFKGQGTPENVKVAQDYGMKYRQFVVIE